MNIFVSSHMRKGSYRNGSIINLCLTFTLLPAATPDRIRGYSVCRTFRHRLQLHPWESLLSGSTTLISRQLIPRCHSRSTKDLQRNSLCLRIILPSSFWPLRSLYGSTWSPRLQILLILESGTLKSENLCLIPNPITY